MNVILGVDQSLTHTGVIILKDSKLIECSTYVPNCKGVERMCAIVDHLVQSAVLAGVDAVVIEGVAHGAAWGVADSGGLSWAIRMAFFKVKRPVLIVAPQTLKKWVTGNGHAQKNEMMRSAAKKWPKTAKMNEHEVDAYGLADIGTYFFFQPTGLGPVGLKKTKIQDEILEKLKDRQYDSGGKQ